MECSNLLYTFAYSYIVIGFISAFWYAYNVISYQRFLRRDFNKEYNQLKNEKTAIENELRNYKEKFGEIL